MSKKSIKVHPLVIVSACDHHTRVSVGGSLLPNDAPTIGLLFGSVTQQDDDKGTESTSLHVIDATDAVYTYASESTLLSLDIKQIINKRDLWVQVYPTQPLLGWYAIGSEVTPLHMAIHRDISALVDSPDDCLMLLMDPNAQSQAKQLPILLFELQGASQQAGEVFEEMPFKLESSPIESVVMDKVITSNPPENVSSVEVRNDSLLASLRALVSRVDLVLQEVVLMQSGEMPVNYELLRKAAKLCNLLPTLAGASDQAQKKLGCGITEEVTDSLVLSLLGTVEGNLRQLRTVHTAYQEAGFGEGRAGGRRR